MPTAPRPLATRRVKAGMGGWRPAAAATPATIGTPPISIVTQGNCPRGCGPPGELKTTPGMTNTNTKPAVTEPPTTRATEQATVERALDIVAGHEQADIGREQRKTAGVDRADHPGGKRKEEDR